MRKKLLSGLLCLAMAASVFIGCEQSGTQKNSASNTKTVGIAMPTKTLERWNRDGSYLKEKFEKAGYHVEIAYSDNDIQQQVKDIQNMISDNVDILIVVAIDCESLSSVLADAKSADIPVISYDRLIRDTYAVSYYVSFDNYRVGQLQGQYIVDTLDLDHAGGATYNLEITAGDPNDNNSLFFYNGAMDVLNEYIDAGTLKIPSGQKEFDETAIAQWDTSTALDRMQNILASYYADGETRLDVCLCSNDAVALGVTQAIQSGYKGKNTPVITGQDGDEENLKNILDGKQSMTVYKALQYEAVVTLELAKEILLDKRPAKNLISAVDFEVKYDTKSYDNGMLTVPSYLLAPETVTKDNYKEALIEPGYYTEGSDGYLKAVE